MYIVWTRLEGEIIEISHRSVIPDNSYGIPESIGIPGIPQWFKEFKVFQGIPKIIPNNSKESKRIPKIYRSVMPTIISPYTRLQKTNACSGLATY
jgi:hypothetical protein